MSFVLSARAFGSDCFRRPLKASLDPATLRPIDSIFRKKHERLLALSPIALLAACGGGGGNEPLPPPPSGGTPPPAAQPDVVTPPVGNSTASGNVLANDAAGAMVTAIAVEGGAPGAIGQPLQGQLGQLTIQSNGTFSYAIGSGSTGFVGLAEGQTATETFVYTPTINGAAGAPQTLSIMVTGVNDTPLATNDVGAVAADAAAMTGNVLVNDSDPDAGSALAVMSVRAGAGQTAQSVQGAKATGLPAVAGTYGTLSMQSDGSYSYALDQSGADLKALKPGENRSETFTYTVSDGKLSTTATLSFTITGVNDAPVAKDDGGELAEDASTTSASGNVLTNDSDPEGAAITVTHAGGQALAPDPDPFAGAAPSGYTGKIASVTGTYGRLYIQEDGLFSYALINSDPDTNALASGEAVEEIFAYTVRDASGLTSTANIKIKIAGATDVEAVADLIEVSEAAAPGLFTGNIFSNDSGFTPTAAIKSAVSGNVGITPTLYGNFTIQTNGNYSFALSDNTATSALAAGASATLLFQFIVTEKTDGSNLLSTITVKINGVNDVPVANADAAAITEDASPNTLTGNVRNNDGDPDNGDVLTVTAVAGGSVGQSRLGIYGSVMINSNGSYTYTLDNADTDTEGLIAGQTAFDDFTYSVSDGKGGSASAMLRVAVTGSGSVIVGTAVGETLTGATFDDLISGLGGDDTLVGLAGADSLDGGDGFDTVEYSLSPSGVTVWLNNGMSESGGHAHGDFVSNVEAITGSAFADVLTGDNGSNTLAGGVGDDRLTGAAGDDMLLGEAGDDQLIGNGGADVLSGGSGTDTANYGSSSAAVTVSLVTGVGVGGDAEGDTFSSIENLVGSGGNDNLTGDEQANVLMGYDGDDDLSGGLGNDLLVATRGSDVLLGEAGDDTLVAVATNAFPVTTLNGGAGADQFILAVTPMSGFGAKFGSVRIEDFTPGTDVIDLSDLLDGGGEPASFADIMAVTSDLGAYLSINLNGFRDSTGSPLSGSVRLEGVANVSDLSASNFVFVTGPQWEADVPSGLPTI